MARKIIHITLYAIPITWNLKTESTKYGCTIITTLPNPSGNKSVKLLCYAVICLGLGTKNCFYINYIKFTMIMSVMNAEIT